MKDRQKTQQEKQETYQEIIQESFLRRLKCTKKFKEPGFKEF